MIVYSLSIDTVLSHLGLKSFIITYCVTVQYPHSYRQKSMQNRLWRWGFCLAVVHFLTVSEVNAQTY